MGIPRRSQRDDSRRGTLAEPWLRDGSSELRDVGELLESGNGADRAPPECWYVREARVYTAQASRREGSASPPRQARRQAHQADAGSGGLPRSSNRRAVQAGDVPILETRMETKSPPGGGLFFLSAERDFPFRPDHHRLARLNAVGKLAWNEVAGIDLDCGNLGWPDEILDAATPPAQPVHEIRHASLEEIHPVRPSGDYGPTTFSRP